MSTTGNALLLAALLALSAAMPAAAAEWRALPAGSSLVFEGTAQGERFEGRFERFDAHIRFDPEAPEQAQFDVAIELGSVDSDNDERDEALRSAEFFDIGAQPTARYRADRVHRGGEGWVAEGELTLNGHTRPVPLAFRWSSEGGQALLEGEATLDRLAFGVGAGEWSDADMIEHAVQVRTRLVLIPAR